MDAREFLAILAAQGIQADLVLLDPPYSPRQISECYRHFGKKATAEDTQNGRLITDCRKLIAKICAPGAVVLSFGWNSAGMGKPWEMEEILIVAHGGAHNDTICVADRLPESAPELTFT